MKTIEKTKIELSYKQDIQRLEDMLKTYNQCKNMTGGFHSSMVDEINSQIEHCNDCIKNLKNN